MSAREDLCPEDAHDINDQKVATATSAGLHRAAYHEAGHAVAGRVLGLPCGALIRSNSSGYSITRTIHDVRDLRSTLTAKLQVCLAGPLAEE